MTGEMSVEAREARTRSRWKLLYLLVGLLVFWVLMMVMMYFTTVYPRRHGRSGPAVDGGVSSIGSESVAPGLPVSPVTRP